MPLRVTHEVFYRQTIMQIERRQTNLAVLNEQYSTGKKINVFSDDSIGAIAAYDSHRALSEITQYEATSSHAKDWVTQGESSLRSMSELLTQIKERAEQMSTGTYTGSQREMIAKDVQSFYDQLVELANSKVAGDFIFAGTLGGLPAVSQQMQIENPSVADAANTGPGALYGLGDFSGRLSRSVELTIDAGYGGGVPSAANPMTVNYSYVDDYGRTVTGSTTLTGVGSGFAMDVGDGVKVYAEDRAYAAGDSFTMTIGRYRGNEAAIEANLTWASRMRINYTLEQFFRAEGYSGGKWNSVLDQVADWIYALEHDDKEQDYFEAVPSVSNHPTSSPTMNITGEWERLKARDVTVYVGGPIQSESDNDDLAHYRNFTVDAAYAGGVPSAANPMTVNYEYWDGTAWQNGTAAFTGVGSANPQNLTDAPGHPVDLFLVDGSFSAGQALDDPGGPIQSTATAKQLSYYRNFQVTTASTPGSEPAGTVLSYEYWDEATQSWSGPATTGAFAGGGAGNSVTLQNVPSAGTVQIHLSDVGFGVGDSWAKLPDKIGSDVTPQSGPPPLNVDFTYTFMGANNIREFGTGQFSGTGQDSAQTITAGSDSFTIYLPENGSVADLDSWSATLEQYNNGQEKSQNLLPELETMSANLLTYVADAGARMNRLEIRAKLFTDDKLRLDDRLASTESVALDDVAVDLKSEELLYQAALQATALISGQNLADYL